MTVISDGSREQLVAINPADEAGDLDRVLDRAGPETEALPRLVELGGEGPIHVEVAGLDRQVVGFERTAALLVDDVECADEPDVVHEVGVVARPPAAIDVADEGGAADGTEDEVRATKDEVPFRVASVQAECGGRERDKSLGLGGVETDPPVVTIHERSGGGERLEHAITEDLDPDLGQDPERGVVDRLDLVCGEDLERAERVDEGPPGQLLDPGCGAARPSLMGRGRAVGRRFARLVGGVHGSMLRRGTRPGSRPSRPMRRGGLRYRASQTCLRREDCDGSGRPPRPP